MPYFPPRSEPMKRILAVLRAFVRDRFSLAEDKENEFEIIESIKKSVPFKGINLWLLIFAILICSVGLNINSTAVVIGAMLISPLMGPIMGLGLSAGINDIALMRLAFKNLFIAVVFSVMTSAIYFWVTPLDDAQSELLSRTSPNIWDVLIALFGGLTGVFAGSSREKGNAIPGVAIATALMPPLCTAGFGLATGTWSYFLGALYLFFINSVMISASTFFVVKFLKFRPVEFMDAARESVVKRVIYGVLIITIAPSLYFGYNIVRESVFTGNVGRFIQSEFDFEYTTVIDQEVVFHPRRVNRVEVLLTGEVLSAETIERMRRDLPDYGLSNTELVVRQGVEQAQELDMDKIRSNVLQDLYDRNMELIASKDEKILLLERRLLELETKRFPVENITRELQVLHPEVRTLSLSEATFFHPNDSVVDTVALAYLEFDGRVQDGDLETIERWIATRIERDRIRLVVGE